MLNNNYAAFLAPFLPNIQAFIRCETLVIHNPEMRIYYEKRISEGKSTMSTLNIIRNKIVSRVFAVVKRGTPYVDTLKYAG